MKRIFFLFSLIIIAANCFAQSLDGSITPSSPAICSGAAVTLTANGSGGTPGYTYFWITTGESGQSIAVTTARTYTVRITDNANNTKEVSINIAANPTPAAPTASNTSGVVCYNSTARLETTAPAGATFNWYKERQGGVPVGSGTVFNTPPVTASTIYYVEAEVNGCISARTGVTVQLAANPFSPGAVICANTSTTLTAVGSADYDWWDSETGGIKLASGNKFTTPILNTTTTYYLEGITSSGCSTARVAVTVNVTQAPAAPTVSAQPICANSRATLQATGPNGVLFDWYDVEVGGDPLITSPDFTTPILNANKQYWVQARINDCLSPRTLVTVVVNSVPSAPQAASDGPVCINSPATLRVSNPSANTTYEWFSSAALNNILGTGDVFTTPNISENTTFYVRAFNASCYSDAVSVAVTVLPVVPKPVISGTTLICAESIAVLNINQPNANYTYEWVDAQNTQPPFTGTTFQTPILNSNTTYYVRAISGGCASDPVAITISLLPLPPKPTVTPVAAICYNTTATLVADNGTQYRWYTAQTGSTPISTDKVYTTAALTNTTTFYVSNKVDGCESERTAITVTVNAATPPPTIDNPGPAICVGTTVVLKAHSAAGTKIQWFSVPTGGNMEFEGANYAVTPDVTTTYYAQVVSGTCISDRTPVTVQVLPYNNLQFQYSAGTYCLSAGNQTPTIYVAGGTFTGSAGLVINPTTGTINIAASGLGRFNVSYKTNNGSCDVITYAEIVITPSANAEFSYANTVYCQSGTNPKPQYKPTSSGGVFSASPSGLSLNSSTGEINLAQSQPGTYTVTNFVNLVSCGSQDTKTFTVEVRASVVAYAGADRYARKGQAVTLSGTLSRSTNVLWSTTNGQGVITNATSLTNASYMPSPTDGAVTFILTAFDTGACGNQSVRVTITFINTPASPTTTTDTVCVGNPATLTAFAQNANSYRWYDAATGGTLLHTGANYRTSPLTNLGISKFWVEALTNGISGPRSEVDVLVESIPTAPQVSGVTNICEGVPAELTAASPNAIKYTWFNADMFPVAVGNKLTIPVFTNTSYFVQAEARDCVSPLTEVKLFVVPTPRITSKKTDEICSGSNVNYTIQADLSGTTFTWSRAASAAINNNQPSSGSGSVISEILTSSSPSTQTVIYVITPVSTNGCNGTPFNYTVTVYPAAELTSPKQASVCNENPLNYLATFNPAVTDFSWSRDVVTGIDARAVANQTSRNIREALTNTTNAPIVVPYHFEFTTANGCKSTFDLPVTVNPVVTVTSKNFDPACSNEAFSYQITSNVTGATFNWFRNAVGNNPQRFVSGVTSINETLVNNSDQPLDVYYLITPVYNGCESKPFEYHVIFNAQPLQPQINASPQVCEGNTLTLQTIPVAGATYTWTLPDGTTATTQTPVYNITNVTLANSGTYALVVTVNGCSSISRSTNVTVINKPLANAGPNQTVCPTATVVQLDGDVRRNVTQQPIAGVWSGGTGSFSSTNDPKAKYFPSQQDRNSGSVTLTLTSASAGDCTEAVSQVVITFALIPAADAGPDQNVCDDETNVALSGSILPGKGTAAWTTTGTGTFDNANQAATIYHPSLADVSAGLVILKLKATGAGACDQPEDEIKISFVLPPTAKADSRTVRYVSKGGTITLNPVVSDENVTYKWSPMLGLSDATIKNPVVTGGETDITYTLVITSALGCKSDPTSILVKVAPEIKPPNTFTPNADGRNDQWLIEGIEAYKQADVRIYSRQGQQLYYSIGYAKPWDGTSNGKPVPFGTYYYIIDVREFGIKLTGYVSVIR
ncbi:Ig-like domain-containing protein [Mucilaginibacter auburnensis]|uniref:Gliding motility-associated-like protein n=1 Tax=Mucilaginibacter auburnensis TaxID=1457233 RepID=A0A2H9VRD7_9SPHI|nr:PKD-like domain-containing protein [Mucilaginibacter auburnensis]PJJ83387.1 gliding motility-associated-like protein [Mucilaginibacter auburnensis]